jgi:hypothetical protein
MELHIQETTILKVVDVTFKLKKKQLAASYTVEGAAKVSIYYLSTHLRVAVKFFTESFLMIKFMNCVNGRNEHTTVKLL